MYISYHSLHDIDLKQVPFHNNNEQFNVQCVCIGETSFLSRWRWVECVLIILRLCHVIHYGVTAGWCIGVAIRRNWCLVIFSNKGNHYERLSLRASLVLPHHTTQSIYTYAVALFKTHSENYQGTRARQNGRSKMCHLQVAWRQPREDERLVSICSL